MKIDQMTICSKVFENISIMQGYTQKTKRSYSKEDILRAVDFVKTIKHLSEVLQRCVVLAAELCHDGVND